MAKKRSYKKKSKQKDNIIHYKYYLPFEFANLEGLEPNLAFHLDKKYKGEKKTHKEWLSILNELE